MDKTASEKIYETAKACLGIKLSSGNPEFGCAITVNNVVQRAIGFPIGGGFSTKGMYECILNRLGDRFRRVTPGQRVPGNIIISPTTYGNGRVQNGHVGIIAKNDPDGILSNDSNTGELHQFWTIPEWEDFYGRIGGFPVEIFEILY